MGENKVNKEREIERGSERKRERERRKPVSVPLFYCFIDILCIKGFTYAYRILEFGS